MNENTQSLPAAARGPAPCESEQEEIDAYVKLSHAAVGQRFASLDFQRRLDEAAQADGNIPPGFDLQEYCGYDSAIAASRESISREKAARIEGFMAGVAAERERCAKIADSFDCYESPEIARLIRSGE